ncbi:hypothetical protein [Iodidimonas gelatinilytica]|uniref:hypothetical protein n=1 Tax=Iodidimonas gelatinilytica TaxID=1236966 RepID=UPI001B2FE37A|nr:hypothetical protein [Iodidimonas gelatinilytica]
MISFRPLRPAAMSLVAVLTMAAAPSGIELRQAPASSGSLMAQAEIEQQSTSGDLVRQCFKIRAKAAPWPQPLPSQPKKNCP